MVTYDYLLPSAFKAVFDLKYLKVQVGSKKFLKQFGLGVRILHNYQIYFDHLLCFQEISMTESNGQNSALNSTVKPWRIINHDYECLFMRNTQFCRIKGCGGAGCPPPPPPTTNNFPDLSYPNKLYIVGKRIYWRVRIIKNIGKIFWFRDFMSNFREIGGI